jgi:hypothetical protein
MMAKFVKSWVISMLVIAAIVVSHSAAWCQGPCILAANGLCQSPGAVCDVTLPTGTTISGTCTNGARPDTDFKCNCVDKAGGIVLGGQPAASAKKKSGGGSIALATFIALIGTWGLVRVWHRIRPLRRVD